MLARSRPAARREGCERRRGSVVKRGKSRGRKINHQENERGTEKVEGRGRGRGGKQKAGYLLRAVKIRKQSCT